MGSLEEMSFQGAPDDACVAGREALGQGLQIGARRGRGPRSLNVQAPFGDPVKSSFCREPVLPRLAGTPAHFGGAVLVALQQVGDLFDFGFGHPKAERLPVGSLRRHPVVGDDHRRPPHAQTFKQADARGAFPARSEDERALVTDAAVVILQFLLGGLSQVAVGPEGRGVLNVLARMRQGANPIADRVRTCLSQKRVQVGTRLSQRIKPHVHVPERFKVRAGARVIVPVPALR